MQVPSIASQAGSVDGTEVAAAKGVGITIVTPLKLMKGSCRSIMLPPRRTGPADTARGARRTAAIENLKNNIFVGSIVGTSVERA
jgi:hypothetical protein